MKTKVIALCGKAGSGKDTILKRIATAYPQSLHEIISCTTRPPRQGEKDGINYHFLSDHDFDYQVFEDHFIECTNFNNWWYGTRFEDLNPNKINIGVFNPKGIYALSATKNIELKTFFIYCDDKTRMLRQLNREDEPNIEEICRRYLADKEDFSAMQFEYTWLTNRTQVELALACQQIITWMKESEGQKKLII